MTKSNNYTERLDAVFQEFKKEFSSVCSRKSFNKKIHQLCQAEGKSNKPSLLNDLYNMLDACNISYEKDKSNDYYANLINSSSNIKF